MDLDEAHCRAEYAPLYCPDCDLCYCGDHWEQQESQEMKIAGGTARTGTCPLGHRRILAD